MAYGSPRLRRSRVSVRRPALRPREVQTALSQGSDTSISMAPSISFARGGGTDPSVFVQGSSSSSSSVTDPTAGASTSGRGSISRPGMITAPAMSAFGPSARIAQDTMDQAAAGAAAGSTYTATATGQGYNIEYPSSGYTAQALPGSSGSFVDPEIDAALAESEDDASVEEGAIRSFFGENPALKLVAAGAIAFFSFRFLRQRGYF